MIVQHMYQNPASQIAAAGETRRSSTRRRSRRSSTTSTRRSTTRLAGYGEIEELNVARTWATTWSATSHKFADEEHSDAALKALFGRFYAGRPLVCEFSPVTDFREARCRQYDEAVCTRGGYCNFMHIRTPSRSLRKDLGAQAGAQGPREARAPGARESVSSSDDGRARARRRGVRAPLPRQGQGEGPLSAPLRDKKEDAPEAGPRNTSANRAVPAAKNRLPRVRQDRVREAVPRERAPQAPLRALARGAEVARAVREDLGVSRQ